MNEHRENTPSTLGRDQAEQHLEAVRQQGGMFVEAVRLTRMPMIVTDAVLQLPGATGTETPPPYVAPGTSVAAIQAVHAVTEPRHSV